MTGSAVNNTEGTETVTEMQQSSVQIEHTGASTMGQNVAAKHTSDNIGTQSDTEQGTDVRLKTVQVLKYRDRHSGALHTAKVLGHADKATGKYKNWYNLLLIGPTNVAGSKNSVDISYLESLQIEPAVTDVRATNVSEDVLVTKYLSFDLAKQEEMKCWRDNSVFEEVQDEGQKCISTRWVCTLKETLAGLVPKARLVARGFDELDVLELQKDSPTCASESLRLLVAVICQRQWRLHSRDIKSAFLQGIERSHDIYIRPPPEAICE